MTFWKAVLSVVLSAVAGVVAAILTGMIFLPLAYPIIVFLVAMAIYHHKNLLRATMFWVAFLAYISYFLMFAFVYWSGLISSSP